MENDFQTGSAIADKSLEFAVRTVNLCKHLRYKKRNMSYRNSSFVAEPALVPMSMREEGRKAGLIFLRK